MITQLDIYNFKALRAVRVPLREYQLLVGPNGTGKSSVFDALLLIRDSLRGEGPEYAVRKTGSETLTELTHCSTGGSIAISIVFEKPQQGVRHALRYTVLIGQSDDEGVIVDAEALSIARDPIDIQIPGTPREKLISFDLFKPTDAFEQVDILRKFANRNTGPWKRILYKTTTGADSFKDPFSMSDKKSKWQVQTRIAGHKQLTLKYAPTDSRMELANWVKDTLLAAPLRIQLDIDAVRSSGSPEKSGKGLSTNGDNFANAVHQFRKERPKDFKSWVMHVRSYLSDIEDIDVEVKPETQRRTLYVKYSPDVRVPQYLLSDGTLRFLALTLLAYYREGSRIVLIEEPENGLHPKAVQGVLDPFMTIEANQQILFASHSPVVLNNFHIEDILVFQKDRAGTAVVKADNHPLITDWLQRADPYTLLASGIV